MRASSLLTLAVLALAAPIAAAPQPLELDLINGTSTRIFHIVTGGPSITVISYIEPSTNPDLSVIEGTRTHIIHTATSEAKVTHKPGRCKSMGTGSWHHHHSKSRYSFVAGTGVVPAPTTSLPSYETALFGSLKHGRASRDGKQSVKKPKAHANSTASATASPAANRSAGNSTSTGSIPSGCLRKNGIAVGWLPDDANDLAMSTIVSDLGGAQTCFYGDYSQITSSTYDDSQLTSRMSQIVSSGAIFIPAVMPSIAFSDVTPEVASQVAATMTKFTDAGVPEVWLRFAHEMNYYVTDGTYHGTASDFVTAWKNVAAAVKANPKVKMFWSPNNVKGDNSQLTPWWPGADTVDVVGIDVYPDSQDGFAASFQGFHDTYAAPYNLPFALGETGWANGGSDSEKRYWLEQVSGEAAKQSCPLYVGFSWFEYYKEGDDYRVVAGDENIAKGVLE